MSVYGIGFDKIKAKKKVNIDNVSTENSTKTKEIK